MTDDEKAEFKAKMAAAKAAKASGAPATAGTTARTVTRSAKTQHEIDLEKKNAMLEDENSRVKAEKSDLEKWIDAFRRPSRHSRPPAAAAAVAEDGGWEEFSKNPW